MRARHSALPARRCHGPGDSPVDLLPILQTTPDGRVRKSSRGRWRAVVLVAVHLAIAAHIAHFYASGRTLSPVEPSESMYTLELGYVNAGFVFFVAALVATFVFGRFFCGWGCHLVALQDLSAWVLHHWGIGPRPFRSRVLVYLPLALAAYMFVWPSVSRLLPGRQEPPFPGFSAHLVTSRFWATFPEPLFAVLTFFVCGCAAVYVLGSKGFCTYACPYGALFGLADRFSPARIRVTSACEQCGHCTAVCTSNVRVHEEVNRFGMVVDPGCMKCMDCVSVCPNDALYYGMAFAQSATSPPRHAVKRHCDVSWSEDIAMVVVCLLSIFAFRGLYDGPPLLLSVALGALTAYFALRLIWLIRKPNVQFQTLSLKSKGKLQSAGFVFAALASFWIVFAVHSGFVQWHRMRGRQFLNRTEIRWEDLVTGVPSSTPLTSSGHDANLEQAFEHFSVADRWGLFETIEVDLGIAWFHILRNELAPAEARIRSAMAAHPSDPQIAQTLFEFLRWQQRVPESIDVLQTKMSLGTPTARDHFVLAGLFLETGRADAAFEEYSKCLVLAPDSPEAHYNLGALLRRLGRLDESVAHLMIARRLTPDDLQSNVELGLAWRDMGRFENAVPVLRNAAAALPEGSPDRLSLQGVIEECDGLLRKSALKEKVP